MCVCIKPPFYVLYHQMSGFLHLVQTQRWQDCYWLQDTVGGSVDNNLPAELGLESWEAAAGEDRSSDMSVMTHRGTRHLPRTRGTICSLVPPAAAWSGEESGHRASNSCSCAYEVWTQTSVKWRVRGLTPPVPFVCRTGAGEQEVDSCLGR